MPVSIMQVMQLLLGLAERLASTCSFAVGSSKLCLRLCSAVLQPLHRCYLHLCKSNLLKHIDRLQATYSRSLAVFASLPPTVSLVLHWL